MFSTRTHFKKRNGVPGTWPAHDQHMKAHDDDDDVDYHLDNVDNVDSNVDSVDNGDNVDNYPHKYILK